MEMSFPILISIQVPKGDLLTLHGFPHVLVVFSVPTNKARSGPGPGLPRFRGRRPFSVLLPKEGPEDREAGGARGPRPQGLRPGGAGHRLRGEGRRALRRGLGVGLGGGVRRFGSGPRPSRPLKGKGRRGMMRIQGGFDLNTYKPIWFCDHNLIFYDMYLILKLWEI